MQMFFIEPFGGQIITLDAKICNKLIFYLTYWTFEINILKIILKRHMWV